MNAPRITHRRRIATITWIAFLVLLVLHALTSGRGDVRLASRMGPDPVLPAAGQPLRFAVLGDVHAFRRPLRETLEHANDSPYAFTIQLGDFVDYDDDIEYRSFVNYVRPRIDRKPLFLVRGNHETMAVNGDFTDEYLRHVPDASYDFTFAGCLFVILDDSYGVIAPPALRNAEGVMERFRAASADGPIFVFLHMPPDAPGFDSPDLSDESSRRLLELAEQFDVSTIFAGHVHDHREIRSGDTTIYISGCGGGSLRAPSPDTHFLEVQVRDKAVSIRPVSVEREWKVTASIRYALNILVPRYRGYVLGGVGLLLIREIAGLLIARRRRQRAATPPTPEASA